MTERSTPLYRVRIAHSKTIKNGWGYETSVEVTRGAHDDGDLDADLKALLVIARAHGEAECERRNAAEKEESLA